jgi:CspA family cold shock protein
MTAASDRLVNIEGVVKWFDPKKGFGFIVGPQGQDIFAHYTKIEGDGFRVLKDGSRVQYDAERSDKGWHASRIIRLDPDPADPSAGRRHYSRTPRR